LELPLQPVLTLAVAKQLADAAKGYAEDKGYVPLIVTVVDPGGHLMYLERGDGVPWGTIEVAILKAQTTVRYNSDSKVSEDALIRDGMIGMVGLPGVACFEGAVALRAADGLLLGAISVSGLTKELDGEIAQAGADALARLLGSD
jgi:uncharacterized protein GlcG (DUF336 family)